jgi:hypothetical protein
MIFVYYQTARVKAAVHTVAVRLESEGTTLTNGRFDSSEPIVKLQGFSSKVMSISVTMPPSTSAGRITMSFVPSGAPAGVNVSAFTASSIIHMNLIVPTITRISHRTSPDVGGQKVTIDVGGLPTSGSAQATFGGVPGTDLSIVFSEVSATRLEVSAPARTAGLTNVTIHRGGASASTSFAFIDSTKTAKCVQLCSFGLSGGRGIASKLELSGFTGLTAASQISSATVLGSQITVSSVAQGTAGNVILDVSIPALAAQMSEESTRLVAFVELEIGQDIVLPQITYVRAPRATRVQFNSVGSRLDVSFDTLTSGTGSADCSSLVNTTGLGIGPSCVWIDPSTLGVLIGRDATIVPGDVLLFNASGILTTLDGDSDTASAASLVVQAPISAEAPAITIDGPNVVGKCDTAVLKVGAASARPLTYEWSSLNNAALNTVLASVSTSVVEIKASAMIVGANEISVQATSFLGAKSEKLTLTVSAMAIPPPILSMDLPPAPLRSSTELFFVAKAKFSSCASSQDKVEYHWYVSTEKSHMQPTPHDPLKFAFSAN